MAVPQRSRPPGRGSTMIRIRRTNAFSLVELVIVIIIGVIAAIAIPRISPGARGAGQSALRGDVMALRNAIDLYTTEHAGDPPTVANFDNELLVFTDETGDAQAAPDATHIFGPYLRAVPPLPVIGEGATAGTRGSTNVDSTAATNVAWIYDPVTGDITANTGTAADETGTLFSSY